jgi:putative phosphoesterase
VYLRPFVVSLSLQERLRLQALEGQYRVTVRLKSSNDSLTHLKMLRTQTEKNNDRHVIGLISDTHGLIRPQALEALQGVALIIHAGDIGKPEVISALQNIAPVLAIKGNNDIGAWAHRFPETKFVKSGNTRLFVIHNVKELDCDPVARGYQVVISGHSHKPSVSTRDGVLFVNPGSAGPRRFKLPIALGKLLIEDNRVKAAIIELPA